MSNIPRAREILRTALDDEWAEPSLRDAIRNALALLDRKKPEFVARRKLLPLTDKEKEQARYLRGTGMAMNDIARRLNTNLGRISEACGA